MMVIQPEFEDDDEMRRAITEALEELLQRGFVEVIGIDENGEWLYQATEAGREFHKRQQGNQQ